MRSIGLFGSALAMSLFVVLSTVAQDPPNEQRVALGTPAVALDGTGAAALEASLVTTGVNGAPDTPVTNVRMVVRNVGPLFLNYVSGVVTFYDSAGVRCGDGLFKADVLAPGESVETDAPGIRIRCSPGSWRIVATNLVPRVVPLPAANPVSQRLTITVDGEEHPIQLGKPMVLTIGQSQKTIVLRHQEQ